MLFTILRCKRIYNRFKWLKFVFKRKKFSCKQSFITSAKPPLPLRSLCAYTPCCHGWQELVCCSQERLCRKDACAHHISRIIQYRTSSRGCFLQICYLLSSSDTTLRHLQVCCPARSGALWETRNRVLPLP